METAAEDCPCNTSVAILGMPMKTRIRFYQGEGLSRIHFIHATLEHFAVDSTDSPAVVQAAIYVGQLYMLCEQRLSELQQATSDSRVAYNQRVMEELQLQDSHTSPTPEPEKATKTDKLNEVTTASAAIEELVPVLRLMYHGDCAPEVFDCVVDRVGVKQLFTTDYVPLG